MDFSIVGDMGALLGYQELAVGMTFLLTGMIAQDKDIHDSGSRTGKKPRSYVIIQVLNLLLLTVEG